MNSLLAVLVQRGPLPRPFIKRGRAGDVQEEGIRTWFTYCHCHEFGICLCLPWQSADSKPYPHSPRISPWQRAAVLLSLLLSCCRGDPGDGFPGCFPGTTSSAPLMPFAPGRTLVAHLPRRRSAPGGTVWAVSTEEGSCVILGLSTTFGGSLLQVSFCEHEAQREGRAGQQRVTTLRNPFMMSWKTSFTSF